MKRAVDSAVEGFIWCPGVDCENGFVVDEEAEKFECDSCGGRFCAKCKNEYHGNTDCVLFNEEEMFIELIKTGNYKRCACNNLIERSGGCMYMKCPYCDLGFCWECEKILHDIGGCPHTEGHYYNIRQWSANDKDKIAQEGELIGASFYDFVLVNDDEIEELEEDPVVRRKRKRKKCIVM